MKVYTTDKIRNVVLLGHGGAGKTTLIKKLLKEFKRFQILITAVDIRKPLTWFSVIIQIQYSGNI